MNVAFSCKHLPQSMGHRNISCWLHSAWLGLRLQREEYLFQTLEDLVLSATFYSHPIIQYLSCLLVRENCLVILHHQITTNYKCLLNDYWIVNNQYHSATDTRLQNAEDPEGKSLRILLIHSPSPTCCLCYGVRFNLCLPGLRPARTTPLNWLSVHAKWDQHFCLSWTINS